MNVAFAILLVFSLLHLLYLIQKYQMRTSSTIMFYLCFLSFCCAMHMHKSLKMPPPTEAEPFNQAHIPRSLNVNLCFVSSSRASVSFQKIHLDFSTSNVSNLIYYMVCCSHWFHWCLTDFTMTGMTTQTASTTILRRSASIL